MEKKKYINVQKNLDARRFLIEIDVLSEEEEERQKTLSDHRKKVKD